MQSRFLDTQNMTAAQYAPHVETVDTHESPTIQSYSSHSISRSLSLSLSIVHRQTSKHARTHARKCIPWHASAIIIWLKKRRRKKKKGKTVMWMRRCEVAFAQQRTGSLHLAKPNEHSRVGASSTLASVHQSAQTLI